MQAGSVHYDQILAGPECTGECVFGHDPVEVRMAEVMVTEQFETADGQRWTTISAEESILPSIPASRLHSSFYRRSLSLICGFSI